MSYSQSTSNPWKCDRLCPGVLLKSANPLYEGAQPSKLCLALEDDAHRRMGTHPGIMKCHGLLKKRGEILGLKFDDGMHDTLQSAIKSSDYGLIPLETRKKWCHQLVEALVFCHGKGVLHEDVHPANVVLVRESPDTSRLQLANFGAAQCERLGLLETRINHSGFSNPKINLEMGPAADIFAVGSVIYTIMTGRFPGAQGPISTFRECMQYSEWTDRLFVRGDVPPIEQDMYAAYVIVSCWKGNYNTALEVLRDLQKEI